MCSGSPAVPFQLCSQDYKLGVGQVGDYLKKKKKYRPRLLHQGRYTQDPQSLPELTCPPQMRSSGLAAFGSTPTSLCLPGPLQEIETLGQVMLCRVPNLSHKGRLRNN